MYILPFSPLLFLFVHAFIFEACHFSQLKSAVDARQTLSKIPEHFADHKK